MQAALRSPYPLALISALLICLAALHASAEHVVVKVEPRIVTVDGILRVKVIEAPGPVVVRLVGPVSTSYISLEPGSIAAISLRDYEVKPGLYHVEVYDAPGGHVLAKIPVLVAKPVITINPPHPVVGKPFRIIIAIDPPGFGYQITVKLDGDVIGVARPGQPVKTVLAKLQPYRICIDVSALIEAQRIYVRNLTCRVVTPDQPPRIEALLDTVGRNIVLYVDYSDPDGVVVSTSYNCTLLNITRSGYVESSPARVHLFSIDELQVRFRNITLIQNASITCVVTAIDDYGAKTTVTVSSKLSELLPSIPPQHATPRQPRATATPAPLMTPSQRQVPPASLLVAAIAIAVGGAGVAFLLVRRRRRVEKKVEVEKPSMPSTAELERRIYELEARIDRLLERVSDLEISLQELREKVRKLESRR